MHKSLTSFLLLILSGVFLSACAGPTTPFGALNSLTLTKKTKKAKVASEFTPLAPSRAKIEFYPERQLLHKTNEFKVKITDPDGVPAKAKITVYYQDYDVSERFLANAIHKVNRDQTQLTLEYNHLRLLAERRNNIRFTYRRHEKALPITADYLAPYCNFQEMNNIQTLGSFRPPQYILKYIEHWSVFHKVNPTLIAGLVAQESSFDTRAVSWAKAIGLTQVTNLADQDIQRTIKDYEKWPRSEAIQRYPATMVKAMILSGEITAKDDYRLDPEKSVQGGLGYIKYLENYWRRESNYQVLTESFGDPELIMTEVLLASYNSGAARVKSAIKRRGVNYLNSSNLNEARKYVRNINSYCFHFSQGQAKKGVAQ